MRRDELICLKLVQNELNEIVPSHLHLVVVCFTRRAVILQIVTIIFALLICRLYVCLEGLKIFT